MEAHARLAVSGDHSGRTRIDRLGSAPPMVLRPTLRTGPEMPPRWRLDSAAQVSVAASAAGPVGGDHLRLDVDVRPGAELVLRTVAATLALPGPRGEPSHTETTLRVAGGATLLWLPEPVIAANRCDHRAITRIHLEPGARLLVRDELLLGRHGESSGAVRQRLRITHGQRPLHDQDVRIGAFAPGWDGPAVTGGRTALGSLILVDPALDEALPPATVDTDVAALPLHRSAMLVTALADDALTVRRRLDEHFPALDDHAEPSPASAPSAHSTPARGRCSADVDVTGSR